MTEGKLVVINNKTLQVQFINSKEKAVHFNVKESELSATLMSKRKNAIAELNEVEVEFEVVGGQPQKIREKGQAFQSHNMTTAISEKNERSPSPNASRDNRPSSETYMGDFHNPYNFVPALPRSPERFTTNLAKELGDSSPAPHGIYCSDRWSGKIAVTLKTITPLLIPDAANLTEDDNGHKTYPIRMVNGKPYLPPTSIKGMLRSAYEAVTNSRLSVFQGHGDRLFYRMGASEGLSLVPARIQDGQIHLMFGTTAGIPTWDSHRERWQIPQNTMYAAWLPQYRRNNRHNLEYTGMRHGSHVRVRLELYKKTNQDGRVIFKYWLVRDIVPFSQCLGNKPEPGNAYGSHSPVPNEDMIETDGYVCITRKNIKRKHDERVFFQFPSNITQHHESYNHLITDWESLIGNYQKIHEDEERGEDLEWSRHVVGGNTELELKEGTLCYASVERENSAYQVRRIYPVMISRAIHDLSPDELLSPTLKLPSGEEILDSRKLKPASKIEELSPADRVLGWANQKGEGAYKGSLRIYAVQCNSDDAIEHLDQLDAWKATKGLPLTILGKPKPEQSRFYAAANFNGAALENGSSKSEGYKQGLRGRKLYPHHQLPEGYWNANTDELKIGERYREYFHPVKDQTTQNRTIKAWVKPEKTFSFEIHITNLSNVELGALLWLLKLSEHHPQHYYRLGSGKPLGFGSVELNITDTDLRTGRQWKHFYQSLLANETPNQEEVQNTVQDFQQALEATYNSESPIFIQAFLKAAEGFKNPIHYPRITENPNPNIESFRWFVDNENERDGQRLSLPELIEAQGLPLIPKK